MRQAILYTVDGNPRSLAWCASVCKNVSWSTIRTRLLAGATTIAELDKPRAGVGYVKKEPERKQTPDAAINGWRRRGRPADLVARL